MTRRENLYAELGKKALFVGPVDFDWYTPIKDRIFQSLRTSRRGNHRCGAISRTKRSLCGCVPYPQPYHAQKTGRGGGGGWGLGHRCRKGGRYSCHPGDLHPEIDPFFGVGEVTKICKGANRTIMPVVAIMMAASSGAHLTKYSNITDPLAGQKKLIVDEAIIPPRSVFDYDVTVTQPMSLTLDGGLDGIAHCLEVYFGAAPNMRDRAREVAELGLELIIRGLTTIKSNPTDKEARTLLGMGTDLGGYAIMIGGTSGAHLTSFSLVDVLSHGRACALMNPYYVVFFAPAIEEQLRIIGDIYKKYGYIDADLKTLSGRELGLAVAGGMVKFSQFLEFPICLSDVKGIGTAHIDRCLTAAKNPQLDMKLRNMPVSLNADLVDEYMKPILEAAWGGDFEKIKNMK